MASSTRDYGHSSVHRGIFYFAESDVTPAFSRPRVHFLGSSRNLRVALGNQTLYWRAYSQYLGSDPSAAGRVRYAANRRHRRRDGHRTAVAAFDGSGTAPGTAGGSGFGRLTESVSGPLILR